MTRCDNCKRATTGVVDTDADGNIYCGRSACQRAYDSLDENEKERPNPEPPGEGQDPIVTMEMSHE